jgi:L-alanine-DL-glutamate epimerase-like enolase superfamily enzyme
MLKIMALCDTHKVGIIPHFTGPVSSAAHMQTMMAFPGLVLMEFNITSAPDYVPEFVELRNGKLWPNDRPGLGITLENSLLTAVETLTEGSAGSAGNTYRRPDGSPTHW